MRYFSKVVVVLSTLGLLFTFVPKASANNFSFTGTFSQDNQVQLFSFTVGALSNVTLRSWSYAGGVNAAGQTIAPGGFDPILALFDGATGSLIGQNDDGLGSVASSPITGAALDTFLQQTLGPGTYVVAMMQYNNFAKGPTLADGFVHDNDGNYTPTLIGVSGCSSFVDVTGHCNDGHWAFDILGVNSASMISATSEGPQPYEPNEPGSVLVFPKFVRGTVTGAAGVLPVTEIEISVHCPVDEQPCAVPGTNQRLMGHWVCPGDFSSYICRENNFVFTTTVEGTVSFNAEASVPPAFFATVRVPAPPCPEGFLAVWAVDNKNRPIAFNGLVGDAVVRWNGHAAGSYKAIAIQSVGLATGGLITGVGSLSSKLSFDGLPGHYAAITGTAMATIKYDTNNTALADGPSTTSLTLLTLDVLSNRPNFDVFTDIDFYDASENVLSEFSDFVCWEDVPLIQIDSALNRDFMSRKGFFTTLDANKVAENGITDTAGPVTLIGLIDTIECQGSPICVTSLSLNHTMYKAEDDSIPVATTFVGP